jgi:beta-1,4-mannosyl-glycoprotein beta-1,4-N-acetylglucosaminyltransferase
MRIFDCFTFCDEKMLLELRLNILNKYVDFFVVVESNFYHNGSPKSFNFNANDFLDFKNKIIYIKVDQKPSELKKYRSNDINHRNEIDIFNSLVLENYQRNKILNGLDYANPEDIIIISDVDEIPNLDIYDFTNFNKKFIIFEQDLFYYKFNLKHPHLKWYGSKAVRKKDLKKPQELRNLKSKVYPWWRFDIFLSKKKSNSIKIIKNCGWHFTNIKNSKDLYKKLTTFLHHTDFENSNLREKDLDFFIKNKILPYDHTADKSTKRYEAKIKLEIVNNTYLPKFLTDNIYKYKEWFQV